MCQLVCVVAVDVGVLVVVVCGGVVVAGRGGGVGGCVDVDSVVADVVAVAIVVDRCRRFQTVSLDHVHRLPDHGVIFRGVIAVKPYTVSSQRSSKSVLIYIRRGQLPTPVRYQHACDTTDTMYWLRPVLP